MAGSPGLNWQTVQIPLASGMDTKGDVRAGGPPGLEVARDVEFDELGGQQTRKPFVDIGSNAIAGGGTLAAARAVVPNGDELLVFTADSLYSWSPQQLKWLFRAPYMAVNADERGVFVGTGDQIDSDRAELGTLVVYAWVDAGAVFVGAMDKVSSAIVVAPTQVSTAVGRPRLVATTTRILLFVDAGASNLTVRAIDPASPATGIAGAGTNVIAGAYNVFYDVVKIEGQDAVIGVCRRSTTTSYSVFTVTAALAISTATKARVCDGAIAVVTTPTTGTSAQIVRRNGSDLFGDFIVTATLADTFTGQGFAAGGAVGLGNLTVAYQNATTAVVFWSRDESNQGPNPVGGVYRNTITTSNIVGSVVLMVRLLGVASRAFTYAGHAYVWLVFACESLSSPAPVQPFSTRVQLQNTYFLYRDDGLLVARTADEVAGGFTPAVGRLPGVAPTSGTGNDFAWCGTARRSFETGGNEHSAYDARSPRDIAFSFDSNAARRCVRIGKTLYTTGSIPMQYDGASLVEVGFLIYPFALTGFQAAGPLGPGVYSYKSTMRWQNAQGEQERSTTAVGVDLSITASTKPSIATLSLNVTLKAAARIAPAIEIWRTRINPNVGDDYYLITSKDPTALAGDNRYIANDVTLNQTPPSSVGDVLDDITLLSREANPENGDVLEFIAPPGAAVIAANDVRVFLGAVAGDPDRVWYSRLRSVNEIVSFNDLLTVDVPPPGGAITAIVVNGEMLIVFRQTAIYAFPGSGLTNNGTGTNYGPVRIVSADVGALSQEATALTPLGTVFKSRKGWYLLGLDGALKYIGDKASAFDADVITSIDVVETQHQVRALSAGRMLVWDYLVSEWSEWTVADGVDAAMWRGSHVYLTSTGPKVQATNFVGTNYGLDTETAWIKANDLQGAMRIRWLEVLGEFRSSHLLRLRVARDYRYDGLGNVVYDDDVAWPPSPLAVGSALQVRHALSQGACEAVKVRITAVTDAARALLGTLSLSPAVVPTLTTPWDAQFIAFPVGAYGNQVSLNVAMEYVVGAVPFVIDVREHFVWNAAVSRWTESLNTIGIRIVANEFAPPTVGQLQAAIAAAGLTLALLVTPDNPAKVLSPLSGNWNQVASAQFTGGAFGAPSGEALKLTGLGLEVGVKPGLHRRLPVAQKV